MTTSITAILAAFTGTGAPWPVWRDSTTAEVRFTPSPKKKMVKLWHRACEFDRQTKIKRCHGGAVGHMALKVLHALIFDFLHYASGRLDPGYAAIARKANVCERTVASALQRLKSLGILNWIRRCSERVREGRHELVQETNAYAIADESAWRGYREPPAPPPPLPVTWGAPTPMPTPTGDMRETADFLAAEADAPLMAALARLGRAVAAKPS
jgi:hypothetical protein